MSIAENVGRVREQMADACAAAHRSMESMRLIAISKTHPVESVLEAVAAGLTEFGENRVEEAQQKIPATYPLLPTKLCWHMVGHIQSRKARDVVPLFDVIQSVDSSKLALRLDDLARAANRRLDVLLEVNVSGEESKFGFAASDWERDVAVRERITQVVQELATLPGLRIVGLMTMAPIVISMEEARPVFVSLAGLRAHLVDTLHVELPELSMGMTDDFPVAIQEGATMLRIGRAIFGERLVRPTDATG